MEAIQAELINLIVVILTTFAGFITKQVVSLLKKRGVIAQLKNNKELVKIVVEGIEQAYKHLDGEEKFALAKNELVRLMESKKIDITIEELDLIIEAMVKEMNDSAKKELGK